MNSVMRLFYIVIFMAVCMAGCTKMEKDIGEIISTDNGDIMGYFIEDSGVYAFKGIPYAKAPTDTLRWRPPQPADSWEGIRSAVEFGPICQQADPRPFLMWTQEFIAPAGNMSEDCLSLNIWAPEGHSDQKRPVLVFIHGGAFTSGSGSVPIYDGTKMAQKGVVFVTINYRLGIFGFLAHPDLSRESEDKVSGNYGLLDQIAALEWIRRNIQAFGGDPGNVTIAGQSAGAFSVNYLAASPLAKGLFHRAIAQSGGAILPVRGVSGNNTLATAAQRGARNAAAEGFDSLTELRAADPEALMAIQGPFSPVIDGYVLPEPLFLLFRDGNVNDVPLLTGWNADEGNFWGSIQNADSFRRSVEERYGHFADAMLELFPANTDEEAAESQMDLGSLEIFALQSWIWMNLMNRTESSDVYVYHFKKALPYKSDQQNYGAFHTGEVPYAYNTLHKSDRPWNETDIGLAEMMSSYWVNFATNGDPNGQGLPKWEPVKQGDYRAMYFGENIELKGIPHKERLELLGEIYISRSE